MTLAEIVVLALKLSIVALVFTLGLGTTPGDLMTLLRRPGKLARALLAMIVVMPIIAVVIVKLFALKPPVEIALVCLALAPIPPIAPSKMIKAGGGRDYVMALLCTGAIITIVTIPLTGLILDKVFAGDIAIPAGPVAKLVAITVIAPTLAGMLLRMLAPGLAERIAKPLALAATVVLLIGLVLLVAKVGPVMLGLLGDGTLLAVVGFIVLGLVVGHLLGGPTPGERTTLALATASRHPGIALAIATITFPTEKAVMAVVLLYLLAGIVVTVPYTTWRKRSLDGPAPATA